MSLTGREHLDRHRREALEILKQVRNEEMDAKTAAERLLKMRRHEIFPWIQKCNYGFEHPYSIFADRLDRAATLLNRNPAH